MSMHFNAGDKVRLISDPVSLSGGPLFTIDMKKFVGRTLTISAFCGWEHYYRIEEDSQSWLWDGRWFIPVDDIEPEMITISFDPSDKAAAHKMVEEAIKNYYAPKNWTEEEIEQAKELVCGMAMSIVRNGGDLFFTCDDDDDSIDCFVYSNSFSWEPTSSAYAKPHGKDVFNVWIGKCVALCRALKKPIPDFIRYKNT